MSKISWGILTDLIELGQRLDINEALATVLDTDRNKKFISTLNTEKQLYKGVDRLGRRLDDVRGRGYSPITIRIKQRKGQPTDRVTLKDTGDFYRSFKTFVRKDHIVITADTLKQGHDLNEEWGRQIVGLTDESIELLIDKVLAAGLAKYLKNKIVRANK